MQYPKKATPINAPIIDVVKDRWSPLAFDPKPLTDDQLASLFEAARWAQSSYGEEPWRYIYTQKGDDKREILESLLNEGNSWAKNAGVLMISFAKKTFARNGKANKYNLHDTGAASALLTIQATSMGLVTHQMSGYDQARANEALGIPDDYEPGSMMAIGYYPGQNHLPEDMKKREDAPRKRRPANESFFRGKWQG